MHVQIGTPAALALGLVAIDASSPTQPGLLGLALQHPPNNIYTQHHKSIRISGARAHVASERVRLFRQNNPITRGLEMHIEQAAPSHVGLCSDATLSLGATQAVAWANEMDHFDDVTALARESHLSFNDSLAVRAVAEGGLLLLGGTSTDDGYAAVIERAEIHHPMDRDAWALVLFLPLVPKGAPDDWEQRRFEAVKQSAEFLDQASAKIARTLFAAVKEDDIETFGHALDALNTINNKAFSAVNADPIATEHDQRALDAMHDFGVAASGRSLTGLGLYGLVRGGDASRKLRVLLRNTLGSSAGTVMATIADNHGIRHTVHERPMGIG